MPIKVAAVFDEIRGAWKGRICLSRRVAYGVTLALTKIDTAGALYLTSPSVMW